MQAKPIIYWNREKQREEAELVYGDRWVRWLYGTQAGQTMAEVVLSQPTFSRWYGRFQSSTRSTRKIRPFIEHFKIPMEEYEQKDFASFNDFFIRRFRPGRRPFATEPGILPAFAEARYFGFEKTRPDSSYLIKGISLSLSQLLGNEERAAPFVGGPCLIARLCPVDYHRFHFPDDGATLDHYRLAGRLHSVNPVALEAKGDILATNERQVSILETRNFGRLAYIEIGALCVGLIVQTHQSRSFHRGEEKGYFLFGASTVVVLGEAGAWKPEDQILGHTGNGMETLVKLGQPVGVRSAGA